MQRGLQNLEGSLWVEKVAMRGGNRSFSAAIAEKTPLNVAAIHKGITKDIVRLDGDLTGTVSVEKEGVWLACRGSGTRVRLVNREAADENDEPEDLLKAVLDHVKAGKPQLEVAGELKQQGGLPLLFLTSARIAPGDEKK